VAGDGFDFFGHRTAGQTAGIPARNQRQIVRPQHVGDALGVLGKFAVELETFVTDFLALTQGGAQRRFATQGGQIVVAPGNRVDANSDCGRAWLHLYCFPSIIESTKL
jgi:hypothetical protein